MSRMLTRVVIAVIVTATLVSTTRSQAGVEVLTANQRVLVIAAVGGQIGHRSNPHARDGARCDS